MNSTNTACHVPSAALQTPRPLTTSGSSTPTASCQPGTTLQLYTGPLPRLLRVRLPAPCQNKQCWHSMALAVVPASQPPRPLTTSGSTSATASCQPGTALQLDTGPLPRLLRIRFSIAGPHLEGGAGEGAGKAEKLLSHPAGGLSHGGGGAAGGQMTMPLCQGNGEKLSLEETIQRHYCNSKAGVVKAVSRNKQASPSQSDPKTHSRNDGRQV